jgi:hypothetical protein
MALMLLALISIAVAVVDGVCVSKLASSYSRCTNWNENSFYINYLDKSLISGGNVQFPSYATVFLGTFNEALQHCLDDENCYYGDFNCATGEFLKYQFDVYKTIVNNSTQLITSNGHISIEYYNSGK